MQGRVRIQKQRRRRHRCRCGKPATYHVNGHEKARADHPLCSECYEKVAQADERAAQRLLKAGG